MLDDINELASSPTFGTWFKDFVDTVAVSWEPFPVFLLFVGSERVRRELASHNESVARIFIPLEVPSWSREALSPLTAPEFLITTRPCPYS